MSEILCPHCKTVLQTPDDRAGPVTCSKCGQPVSLPAQTTDPVQVTPPPLPNAGVPSLPSNGGPPPLPVPASVHQKARKFQEALRFLALARTNYEEGKLDETEVTLAQEAFDEILRLDARHPGTLIRRPEAVAILEAIQTRRREQELAAEAQRRRAAEAQRQHAAAAAAQAASEPSLGQKIWGAAVTAATFACGALLVGNRLVEVSTGRKICSWCGEEIDALATRCPYCTSFEP